MLKQCFDFEVTEDRRIFPVIACLGLLFVWAAFRLLPAEDAVILYDYSKNLARSGVITYSTNTTPIEGATDFLWMLLISLGSFCGLDEFISAQILSFLGVSGLFYLLYQAGLPLALFALSFVLTPYLYATLFGFSALFFVFFYVLALYFAKTAHRYFYWSLLILSLLRPDGVIWATGLLAYRFFNEGRIELKALFGCFVLPFLCYWCGRAFYFGEFWPLPFLVKGFHHDEPWFFYRYSLICIMLVVQPIFFSMFFFPDKKKLLKDGCFLFIAPCLFYGMMRLEQNVGNRMLAPMFWGWLFYLACEIGPRKNMRSWLAVLFFILCSVGYSSLITQHTLLSLLKSQRMNVYTLSKKLDTIPAGRMLVSEAGRLAYYTHWRVEDSWGLNTPFYAHHFLNYEDLKREHYDLIVTHCDLTLLRDPHFYTRFTQKTWGNQSKILLSYLRQENYEIYLVPYDWPQVSPRKKNHSQTCVRYDVYGVSNSFPYHEALRQLLKERGGLRYSSALVLKDDTVCRVV